MVNVHVHTFTSADIPKGFLPFGLVRVLANKPLWRPLAKGLNMINPFSDNDIFDRYVNFVNAGNLGSQRAIFEECYRFYPKDTRFVVLPMDMHFMGAGDVPRCYTEQLKELYELSKIYPNIIPFVAVDPRRSNVWQIFLKCVEEYGFKGVKLYPTLGYFPYDTELDRIYAYCQKYKLPVIAHGSPANPVHFKGSRYDLLELLKDSNKPIETDGKSIKELCAYFTHPLNYVEVMAKFHDLKICIAHFGSGVMWDDYMMNPQNQDNWLNIIKDMIVKYPNFYTDISYTLAEPSRYALLKVLIADSKIRPKVLFGSDNYMNDVEGLERAWSIDLRAYLGETLWKAIAVDNPNKFLNC